MLLGIVLLIGGIALIMWGAEWFTDGAIKTAAVMTLSPFYVGIVVSGFEPENLVTGLRAAIEGFPQIALGTRRHSHRGSGPGHRRDRPPGLAVPVFPHLLESRKGRR